MDTKFLEHDFWDLKVFGLRMFWTENFSGRELFGTQILLDPNFRSPNFFDPKVFRNKNLFDQILFWPKVSWIYTFLWDQNLFETSNFFGPKRSQARRELKIGQKLWQKKIVCESLVHLRCNMATFETKISTLGQSSVISLLKLLSPYVVLPAKLVFILF